MESGRGLCQERFPGVSCTLNPPPGILPSKSNPSLVVSAPGNGSILTGAWLMINKGKVADGADGGPACGELPLPSRGGGRCLILETGYESQKGHWSVATLNEVTIKTHYTKEWSIRGENKQGERYGKCPHMHFPIGWEFHKIITLTFCRMGIINWN